MKIAQNGGTREDLPVCKCRIAHLVVVCEWSSLQVADTEMSLLHLLYIFARGVPVVTRSAMLLADGGPRLVSPSNIIRFSALKEKKILFVYTEQFRATHRLLCDGLIECKGMKGAKWLCEQEPPPPKEIRAVAGYTVCRLQRQCDIRDFLFANSSLSGQSRGFRAHVNNELQL